MDSIVTPEHFHALFYGFDKCTTIKKRIVSLPFICSLLFPFYSIFCHFSLSLSHIFVRILFVCILYSPSRIRHFRLLSSSLLCELVFISLSFHSYCWPAVNIDSRAIVAIANDWHPIQLEFCHLRLCSISCKV